ncbi:hypothetical protein [Derxia gummosa]|uniref:Uncharacterized protein n=1 Tax=Derxia gummosa DSM 723 TaxID=1121388 RepID=A0A8B6XA80_9BURK|nr:hypothetical protein [Derxia gummosa]
MSAVFIPPGDPDADGWKRLGRINPLGLGIALSLLLHAGVLLWVQTHPPLHNEAHSGASAPIAIRIAPRTPPQPEAARPEPRPAPPRPAPEPRPAPRPAPRQPDAPPRVIAVPAPQAPLAADRTRVPPPAPRPLPPLPPLPPDTPEAPAPRDDMFSQLQARRAQRDNPAPAAPAQRSEAEIANDNARRNLAGITGRGPDPVDQTGGVFQVTRVTSREGEILFRGWNQNFKRNWSESVQVTLGDAPDMRTAIVRKMIEIIRRYEKGDFTWESYRLGKTLNLSARPQDQAELERFLLAEFFSLR